jgi:hypothetical protein
VVAPGAGVDEGAGLGCGTADDVPPREPLGPSGPVGPKFNADAPQGRLLLVPPPVGPEAPSGPIGPVGPRLGIPGNRPWFTPHDSPGNNGLALGGLGTGDGAVTATAIGAEPKMAQVTVAIVVTRLSVSFMSFEPPCVAHSGITVGEFGTE